MRGDLAVLAGAVLFCLLTMVAYGLRRRGSGGGPGEAADRGSFVLGSFVRSWFYWFIGPAERLALRAGLHPTFFNLLGVAFGIAGGVAFALGATVAGGWGVLLGGAADVFDGRIARARGIASPRGAFLDSTLDRFAEVAVFAGLAVHFHDNPLLALTVALGLGGSLLVSYSRARGESQGVVCKYGVMQRAERLLLLGFAGLLDSALAGWTSVGPGTYLAGALVIIAVGTLATAVFRTVWIAARLPD